MSNTAKEVLEDLADAVKLSPMRGGKVFSDMDEHRTDDKAWAVLTLRSREQFIVTVEKVR